MFLLAIQFLAFFEAGLVSHAGDSAWLARVNLFFVLSGFLITGILLDSKTQARLLQEILCPAAPSESCCLLRLLLLLGLLGQAPAAYLGLGFVYLANVTELFGVAEAYGPLWSLAVEEAPTTRYAWPTSSA